VLARRLTSHSPSSVAEHYGRDPVTISQEVGKLEKRIREDESLEVTLGYLFPQKMMPDVVGISA
jgi:chromosomal replication initiation ATPase DnaA